MKFTLSNNLPPEQEQLRIRCAHPSGESTPFDPGDICQSIPNRFDHIAARWPNRFALKSPRQSLTYAQLKRAADTVGHQLRGLDLERSRPIVICGMHDVSAIIAMFGVLKAGHFYAVVNLDEIDDLEVIGQGRLADVDPVLILADRPSYERAYQLCADHVPVIAIEEMVELSVEYSADPLVVSPDAKAYITFTSGSTGRAKGVIEDHQDVLHFAALFNHHYQIGPRDSLLFATYFHHGGAGFNLYSALLNGACLHVVDVRRVGINGFVNWIVDQQSTIISLSMSIFRALVPQFPKDADLRDLRLINFGGEPVRLSDVQLYRDQLPDTCLLRVNYGCTEAHFITCILFDKKSVPNVEPFPVGYATSDGCIFLLDESGAPVAEGAVGELAVARSYLTKGYWRNPQLTALGYQPAPDGSQRRIYRTGDLAYRAPDGCLYLVGRADNRVKVRGQFVQADDVERALLSIEDVQQAVVKVCTDAHGGQFLAAYVLSDSPRHTRNTTALYRLLSSRVTQHMLPNAIMFVDELPRSPNGKVDRHALPDPDFTRPPLESHFAPPETPFQQVLADLWSDVLFVSPIGIHDHFLELGGDSLKSMMFINRLQQELGHTLPALLLFEAPTIDALSQLLQTRYAPINFENMGGQDGMEDDRSAPRDGSRQCAQSSDRVHNEVPAESVAYSDEVDAVLKELQALSDREFQSVWSEVDHHLSIADTQGTEDRERT